MCMYVFSFEPKLGPHFIIVLHPLNLIMYHITLDFGILATSFWFTLMTAKAIYYQIITTIKVFVKKQLWAVH